MRPFTSMATRLEALTSSGRRPYWLIRKAGSSVGSLTEIWVKTWSLQPLTSSSR
ncbi:hypothetical protein D3C76_1538240 [compost metagenome]